ncbi:unnamed protein product [Bursaphelenchus xylophilus]|uniref:(pine wood nematode) hypothetical protein n=1 Tax=Bursaphelenchus xylophilus TaxID=6326 RepID=A0A1I7SE98_BURXY|nr:unnamed protein product [Bursaphelenchus xylophilus]CAG9088726.1 unnamed protein product [Bursaphelenchus xylophilus]
MVELGPVLLLVGLFFSVPLQFYLSPSSSAEFKFYLTRLVDQVGEWKNIWLKESVEEEKSFIDEYLKNKKKVAEDVLDLAELKIDDDHFASSKEPRDPRAPWVKYRIGQVFRHKKHKFRGVIVGWDHTANAPKWWINGILLNKKEWIDNPNYLVLIDMRDKHLPQIAYLIEENIEIISGQSIIHPNLEKYFEGFDGTEYRPRPWFREIYPFG